MIQRIQSIFLLLAGTCLGLEFVFPFAKGASIEESILSDSLFNIHDHISLVAIVVIGIIVALGSIISFRNRSLQTKLSYLFVLFNVAILVAAFIFLSSQPQVEPSSLNVGIGAFLPIAAIIFSLVATRFIKKDEDLVQSMDRLR